MELISRSCACGCGVAWRCLSSSPQLYASQICEASHLKLRADFHMHLGSNRVLRAAPRKKHRAAPRDGLVNKNEMARTLGVPPTNFAYWVKKLKIPHEKGETRDLWFDPKIVREKWKETGAATRVYS